MDTECVYCGEEADTKDHLIPTAWFTGGGRRPGTNRFRVHSPWVPACRECNSLLGVCTELNITARRAVVHQRLRKRNRQLLERQPFTEDEIEEHGYGMQVFLRSRNAEQKRLRRRLSYRNWYDGMFS